MSYLVYIIICDNLYYIGMTNNFERRIQQHNSILSGGAKFTKKKSDWKPICIIDGFINKSEVMQCEWAFKNRRGNNFKGIQGRLEYLNILLKKDKWTSHSPFIIDQNLTIYINDKHRHYLDYKTIKELYWD